MNRLQKLTCFSFKTIKNTVLTSETIKNIKYIPKSSAKDFAAFGVKNIFLGKSKKEMETLLNECIISSLKLGEGCSSKVFRIKDTPFVLRIPNKMQKITLKKVSYDISEQEKTNHIVAKINNNIKILNYIEGFNTSAPSTMDRTGKFVTDTKRQKEINKAITQMPVSTYKNYILQLYDAHKNMMQADTYGDNVLINPIKNKLTQIDFQKRIPFQKFVFIDRLVEQLGKNLNQKEQNTVLAKGSLAFLELLESNHTKRILDIDEVKIYPQHTFAYYMFQDRDFFINVSHELNRLLELIKDSSENEKLLPLREKLSKKLELYLKDFVK